LVVLQAMDAGGKDGTIERVFSGINPQGCQVHSFKAPSAEELSHDFLWRTTVALPRRGHIGVFNRSYYEEVLVVRVHPEMLERQGIDSGAVDKKFWEERFESIRRFEQHLTRNGTVILKFFLHVSKEEQRERFLDRIKDPEKHWKFSASDLAERGYWDDYMQAYEEMLSETSTKCAPWYIVPADHKWVSRALVAKVLTTTIKSLDLKFPEVTPAQLKEIAEAKKKLQKS